jgi:hypothetical protein
MASELRKRSTSSKEASGSGGVESTDASSSKARQSSSASVSSSSCSSYNPIYLFTKTTNFMFENDDSAFLAFFRIMWGLIMAYEAWTYMAHDYGKMYYSFYSTNCPFQVLPSGSSANQPLSRSVNVGMRL